MQDSTLNYGDPYRMQQAIPGTEGAPVRLSRLARSQGPVRLNAQGRPITPYVPKVRERLIHQGFDLGPVGVPLPPRRVLLSGPRRPRGPPSELQLAARARLASGESTQAWRAFVAARPGQTRDATVAQWRLAHPDKRHGSRRGGEHSRYMRLQRYASALGVPAVWESTRGLPGPGRLRSARTGNMYPGRWSSTQVAGHPYGSMWQDAAGLHGSGMVY